MNPSEDGFVTETPYTPSLQAPPVETQIRNVLLVDDEDPIRELAAYVLESHGYKVFRARNSREAAFLHSEFNGIFHLLFTDICMQPYEDGFTLAKKLRRMQPDLRIIYASGFVEPERLKSEVESSSALFLPKPFTPDGLLDCVRRCLTAPSVA